MSPSATPPPPAPSRTTSPAASPPTPPPSLAPPRTLSPTAAARIRRKNRRQRYLALHPEYFSSALELADPLAYERFVRRFQTREEREAEGREKGYAGVLEAGLWRGEALRSREGRGEEEEEEEGEPETKEEGWERWRRRMEGRFLRGEDEDFDYEAVDSGEGFDDRAVEEREEEERWFEEEEPRWVTEGQLGEGGEEAVHGETGVQDF